MATKQLARYICVQLGLIRRKSISPANKDSLGRIRSKQLFGYLIIIDFESTCWNDGKRHYSQEIIEFPAVLLNTLTGEIESEFQTYVQPEEHPILSKFCVELTGIRQAQVDEGVPLKICLSQFCKWIQVIQQQKEITFAPSVTNNSASEVKLCAFVTWSDWDLGVCLEYECRRKQLRKPVFLNSWVDLRATYKLFYRRKPKGLSGALQELGIEFSGREHSGLDDSRNTAHLAWHMIRDGCIMKITKSLDKVPHSEKSPNCVARVLNLNQTEDTLGHKNGIQTSSMDDFCDGEINISKNTTNPNGKNHLKSVSRSSFLKIHQDYLPLKSTRNLGEVKSCFSVNESSFPFGKLQPPNSNSPGYSQNQIKSEYLTHNPKYNSSALGSGLVLVSTTISSVNNISDTDTSTSLDCLPMLADWEDVALLPASWPEQKIDSVPPTDISNSGTSLDPGEKLTILKKQTMINCADLGSLGKASQSPEMSGSVVYRSPHTTIYNVKESPKQPSNVDTFKLPNLKVNVLSRSKTTLSPPSTLGEPQTPYSVVIKRKSSSPQAFPPSKKQSFTIHEEKPTSSQCSPVKNSLQKVTPSVLKSIVNLKEPWKSGKMTPPLCNCGRRSKRLIVSNNGPNHGKAFYSCSVGKYQKNGKNCGYFKWEQTLQKERTSGMDCSLSTVGIDFRSPGTCSSSRNLIFSPEKCLKLRPSMRT
ncbi:ERI1 exoribonuclease 2-like isoform X2 [Vombatus ursinus]|uniref:ERI1 exoribonuclease 2-like isoform X2 n=1 Tax=Vombatus ursinus TaxID=29139 RepID=UPI000FFD83CC|nr:ERI1 exoribonuclease 2-like isoform X2 [Vombatus ursinus]